MQLTRTVKFLTSREILFGAWRSAESLRSWFRPRPDMRIRALDYEAAPGGRLRAVLDRPEGGSVQILGKVERFQPSVRLELRLGLLEDDRQLEDGWHERLPSSVTMSFDGDFEGSTLTLVHEGLASEEEVENIGHDWDGLLAELEQHVVRQCGEFYDRVTRGNAFHSRFGGFWPDQARARETLAGRVEAGRLAPADVPLFEHWIDRGYVVLERAVSERTLRAFEAELDRLWRAPHPELFIECSFDGTWTILPMRPDMRDRPHKVLDVHGYSAGARRILAAPRTIDFLTKLMDRPPMGFQSLCFMRGTEQAMHQDTAFVALGSPMELVGSWVALEDVRPGSGELQYFEGSHRIPEYLFDDRARAQAHGTGNPDAFYAHVQQESSGRGCPLTRFLPKRGDVLLWHADLVHGGSPVELQGSSRRSLVTHYCPVDVDPEWMAVHRNSGRLRAAKGAYYCHLRRGN
ncbi:MAG: phytanoyl-CoA dioxygenase family protein [Planctomycetota bacterium]